MPDLGGGARHDVMLRRHAISDSHARLGGFQLGAES